MEQVIEKHLALPKVSVMLASAHWNTEQESTTNAPGYFFCQRLSEGHAAMRIGNRAIAEAFPRVRSVGFMPPSQPVVLFPVDKPFRSLVCVFEKTFFETATEIDPRQWIEHIDAFVTVQNKRVEAMMQQIHAELIRPGFAHNLMIEATSTMLLVEMARYARQRIGAAKANGSSSGQGLAPWQMRRIRERIEASLELGYPGLGELAQLCGISQSHLMHTFKASTGWQIHKYIAEERLNAAKQMLGEDTLSLKEIAARLGFCSPAYFATAFRRMAGMTPTDYRRRACAPDWSTPEFIGGKNGRHLLS